MKQSIKDLQRYTKFFANSVKLANKRCNCENSDCEHKAGGCPDHATGKRIMYLGDVCDSCYDNMPEEYRLPTKLDPYMKLPDPPSRFRPGFNPKHPENPHHMKHRVDIDPDTLSYDNLHPDDPSWAEIEGFDDEEDPFDNYGDTDILIDPEARKKRVEDRKRPKKYL